MNQHRFYLTNPHSVLAGLAAMFILLAATLGILHDEQSRKDTESRLANATARLVKHQKAAQEIGARQRAFATQASAQNQAPQGFTGLEILSNAWREDIALLSVTLDPRKKTLRLELAAHSLNPLLDFVLRLQKQQVKVDLESHRRDLTLPDPWQIKASLNLEYVNAVS